MDIIRPLQISLNTQVLEQDRRFYFTASASLGVDLQTGEALLDLNYLKDVFEAMGESPLPDMGMPKPNGEFLVSGRFFAPGHQPVTGGEAKVILGAMEKSLYLFGPRQWRADLPSAPEKFISMPLEYSKAFGGEGYEKNPEGIGFNDGLLPCVEDPEHLVASKGDTPFPAGFSPLYPMRPQRMKYQGTYDQDYKYKYFPGYPEDHDWKYFLCAPRDQWATGYYTGHEAFCLYHMHPDIPIIKGSLPGYSARCFIREVKEEKERFDELPLNLDTIWFFPEKMIGLLIFRGVTEVEDDEAETITHVLSAYESDAQPRRSHEYYKTAFEKRRSGNDSLLNHLKTHDLIPDTHKSAMEILMNSARQDTDSELVKNMDEKAKTLRAMADEKVEQAIQNAEDQMAKIDIPDDAKAHLSGKESGLDIRELMAKKSKAEPDPDLKKFNDKLESIIPGIMANDPQKIDMKHFSFDALDEIFEAVNEFSAKKEKEAMDIAAEGMKKVQDQIQDQLKSIDHQIENTKMIGASKSDCRVADLEKARQKVENSLKTLQEFDPEHKSSSPLPRVNALALKAQTDQINPQIIGAMQHLQSMKDAGISGENTKKLEQQIQEAVQTTNAQVDEGLKNAEADFKDGYIMTAHFMDEGTSPHTEPLSDVRQRFLDAVSKKEDVSGGDFACIDLSGEILDGIDFSGAFLEQVKFTGASLKGAIFSKAILARANFEGADLTDADFQGCNLGAVLARGGNFTRAKFKSAKLSRGNFIQADFTGADFEDIEALDIVIHDANFTRAHMPGITFLEINITGATFEQATITTSAFLKCAVRDCNFSNALMSKATFVDTDLESCRFENADLANACFMATDLEKSVVSALDFQGACINQANFQNMAAGNTNFSHATMENTLFQGADLSGAIFSHANALNAQFRKSNLTGATLDYINLDKGSLAKANLAGASFKGANLHAVDFLRSNISETDFSGANLDTTLIEHWRPR
jgi:uncharacterized protein YjbI with pentapeptide repeats